MKNWKPNMGDRNTIRAYAERAAHPARNIEMEPGIRFALSDHERCGTNVLLVDLPYGTGETDDWEDSDLFSHSTWAELVNMGVPLTDDGRAEVDIYVYGTDDDGYGLQTNIQLIIENGQLVRLDQTMGDSYTI